MFLEARKTKATEVDYAREAERLVKQFTRENPDKGRTMSDLTDWYTSQHGRWRASSGRKFALSIESALRHGIAKVAPCGWDPEPLLEALKKRRPVPAAKPKFKIRKNVPLHEVRALAARFRSSGDPFDNWIAGFVLLATRLGWRPSEVAGLLRDGSKLLSEARKITNGRGLAEECERDLSPYGGRWLAEIDAWIADAGKWHQVYGGREGLLDNVNRRLATACKHLGFKRICTYSFRHFAIASMKRSGLTCGQIAVLVNHASSRTATDHYGKKRFGLRRAKKLWVINPVRLEKVRSKPLKWKRDFGSQCVLPLP
jgi:integrase